MPRRPVAPEATMTPETVTVDALKTTLLITRHPRTTTYVSADEVERADALALGYEKVCRHPSEVGVLGREDALVVDFNAIQFGDTPRAVQVVLAAARRGVPVGVHAYHFPPALRAVLAEPLVVSAESHARLLPVLRRVLSARRPVAPPV